jgi:hypothetical protein
VVRVSEFYGAVKEVRDSRNSIFRHPWGILLAVINRQGEGVVVLF